MSFCWHLDGFGGVNKFIMFELGFRLRCNRVNRRPRGDRFHFNSRGFGMIGRSDLLNDIFGLLGDLGFTIAMGR